MQTYSVFLPDHKTLSSYIYKSHCPISATRKIFSQILRTQKDKADVQLNIKIINNETKKEYGYTCLGKYAPFLKQVSNKKVIQVNYITIIQKLDLRLF